MAHGPQSAADPRVVIEADALALGFDAVGFASLPEAALPEGDLLRQWLAAGFGGDMGYLDRTADRRADPHGLHDARSAAVLVWRYPDARPATSLEGTVARYARGRDYHNVLGRRMRKLVRACRERWPEERFYVSVDTGAVLEKALAVRAGLGWLGKNTLVLDPDRGSYTLLAVLLLPFPVTPVPAPIDQCGTCQLCLESCPTDAFPQPYVLDARRCISYLTIETRTDIPHELRQGIGDRLFGCDVCQEVCPYNLRPLERLHPAFGDDATAVHELLGPLLALDADADFAALTRGRPLARPQRVGLVRNACVVAGNSGDRRWVAPLIDRLDDPEPVVRRHAAWALGQLGGETARAGLTAALERESDPATREELQRALRE